MNKSYIKYLSSMLLFGMNGIVASNISLSSYEIVFFRTLLGSLFLVFLYLISGRRFHFRDYGTDLLFVALSGISMGTSWMFLYEAYAQIGVSVASLLYYCGPVIVMALSPLIFREKLTLPKILGFLTVFIGIFLVNGMSSDGLNTRGILCGIMSAVTYSTMVMFNKKSVKLTGMANSAVQLIVAFVTVSVFLLIRQGFTIKVSPDDWIWILILGIVNSGLGCYLYFSSLSGLSVQTVAVCGYLELLSAVIFAAIFLHETLSLYQIAGGALIIGGALIGELIPSRDLRGKKIDTNLSERK